MDFGAGFCEGLSATIGGPREPRERSRGNLSQGQCSDHSGRAVAKINTHCTECESADGVRRMSVECGMSTAAR